MNNSTNFFIYVHPISYKIGSVHLGSNNNNVLFLNFVRERVEPFNLFFRRPRAPFNTNRPEARKT